MTDQKMKRGASAPSAEDIEKDLAGISGGSPTTKAALGLAPDDQKKTLGDKLEVLKKKQAVQTAEFNAYTEELQAGWNAKNKTFLEGKAEIEKQITQVEGAIKFLNGDL